MKPHNALKQFFVKRAFKAKAEAFRKAGYQEVSASDIAHYFYNYRWAKETPSQLKRQLNEISQLTPNRYFDFARLEATALKVPSLDEMDLSNLL